MTKELKACPFCGGNGILFGGEAPHHLAFVRCADCDAYTGCYTSTQEAINAWNRRVEA